MRRLAERFNVWINVRPVDGAGIVECPFHKVARVVKSKLVGDRLGSFEVSDQFGFDQFALGYADICQVETSQATTVNNSAGDFFLSHNATKFATAPQARALPVPCFPTAQFAHGFRTL